uniref:Uncharacterized protein n=1 Tax=Avena sativa TaxID=4498 RepID=A0ACD5V2X3_AVESA
MEEAPRDSALAPTMASRVSASHIVVVDVEDDEDSAASTPAALRSRAVAIASATTPSFPDAFSSSPAVPKRRAPESPILIEDDTPPAAKRRPSVVPGSVVPETPQWYVPCSSPRPRAATPDTPDSVLRSSSRFAFDSPDLDIPGSAFPRSVDPDFVLETPDFTTLRPTGPSSVQFVPETPQSFVPCSLDPRPRDAATNLPDSVIPHPFDLDLYAADLGIPGPAFPGSIDPDIIVLDTPDATTLRPSSAPIVNETPQSFVPCSLDPQSRGTVPDMPYSVLPRSFETDFDAAAAAADLGIPEPTFPSSVDPNLVVTETRLFTSSPFDVAGPSNLPEPSSPITLDCDDLDYFGYKEPLDKLTLPCEDPTLQEEDKNNNAEERKTKQEKRKIIKEGKAKLVEEKKRQREENKLLKEASKAQKAEQKKCAKEKADWESGKHALKSVVAEIDSTIIESGSVGGTLLTRFAEKGLKYRVQVNPIRGSILWKMEVPQIGQDPASVTEVPYILFVLQAEEFCDLISSGSFFDHVHEVQSRYPTFTICYVTNKLMNYINKWFKDTWMKALIAIPKVQPRFALAIWKKYDTMRSLLNVYMDPTKTDREKELLLQDLKCEDRVGEESRRVGPVCSKRVYKTLMAQAGGAEADAAECFTTKLKFQLPCCNDAYCLLCSTTMLIVFSETYVKTEQIVCCGTC